MAKHNPARQSATPQAKVRTIQIFRTPEEIRRRERLDFSALEDGLNTICAISDVLDYTGEVCQGQGERLTIIAAGLGEALKVVHRRMTAEIEVR
jgi:hypothetical protein